MLLHVLLKLIAFSSCGSALYHCSEHISGEVKLKVERLLKTHDSKILTGFMNDETPQNLHPLKVQRPPPCGSYSHNIQNLDRFHKTAVQIFRHDPTIAPPMVITVTSIRLRTSCKAHWIGRNELSIGDESLSTFAKLPQDEWEIFHYHLMNDLSSYKPGHDSLEVLGQSIYSCPWLVNPGEKFTYLIRVQSKMASWSPTGYMVSPYYLKLCTTGSAERYCNVSAHTRVYWDKNSRTVPPLIPGMVIGGILETASNSQSNNLCPGVVRFINLKNTFQLSFSVSNIQNWKPEVVIQGEPVFLSEEGIYFSFLLHDGENILSDLCPSWRNEVRRRRSHLASSPKFSSGLPLGIQSATLEEEISWVRAETEGLLGGLFNRTVRELVDLHFHGCQLKNLITEVAIGVLPVDPRPYLSIKLGHPLFKIQQVNKAKFYRTADPVSNVTWDFANASGPNIPVNFTHKGARREGHFSCELGYITRDRGKTSESTKECFLLVHIIGGIDLCTGLVTPSISEDLVSPETWVPKVNAPTFSLNDLSFRNHLEEEWVSSTDSNSLLQSMGHSLLHDGSTFFALSEYTRLMDQCIFWGPAIVVTYLTLRILICCCTGDKQSSLRSRVM